MIECTLSVKDDHVISGSEDGSLYFWDLIQSNIVNKAYIQSRGVVHSLSHHPDSNCLVAACEKTVYVLRLPGYIDDE